MSNYYDIYVINLIRTPSTGPTLTPRPVTRPVLGVPNFIDFITSSVSFSAGVDDWIDGPNEEIKLQFITSSFGKQIIDLSLTRTSGVELQRATKQDISEQYHKLDLYLDSARVQTINYETIGYYTNQYDLKDTLSISANLQRNTGDQSIKLSNQYVNDYVAIANLQKVKFSNIEKDKIIWMMRAVDINTQQYQYWSSQNVNSRLSILNEVPNSREVLGSYFVTGSKINNIHGLLFINNSTLDPFIGSTSDSGSDNLPELQYYIQKNNVVDNREIIKLWISRGTLTDNKHYEYWKDIKLSSQSTTYNVKEESKETLNSIYKKQE